MRDKAVVIFVLGQAQNLMLPSLLARCEEAEIFIFSVYPISGDYKGVVVNIKPSTVLGGLKMLYGAFYVCWRLRFFKKIDFYAPHILNFLANKVYYLCREKIDFYYLFDGILNYRAVPADSLGMRSYQDRQEFKSFLVLHKYVRSFGDVVDQGLVRVRGMMVPDGVVDNKLNFGLPVWKLRVATGSYSPKDRVLVLMPPLKGESLEVFKEKLGRFLIDTYPGKLILIKPHPSQFGRDLNTLGLEQCGLSIDVIADVRPAEVVFIERECCAVVSATSSALLLIKGFYPEAKVYSIIGSAERSDKELMRVVNLMVDSGVIII